ncbi:hypothetical protein HKD37_09G026646 [Glycine soja]
MSKYITLQICDDEGVETMIESFQQQQQMSIIELCVEVDVAGASAINFTNSLLSCENNMSHNESGSSRVGTNSEEDFDDDDYLISNSYVEDTLDEDEDIDEISDTDDEVARLIEPLTIVQSGEGMIKEDPSLKISLIQEMINGMFNYNISYRKAWKAKQKAITIEYGDWDESYAALPSWLKHMQNHSPRLYYQICDDDFVVGNTINREHRQFHRVFWTFDQCKEAFKYCKPMIQVDGTFLYGKYRGTLLMATTQDVNSHVLPLAFVVVEGETLTVWS